VFDLNGTFYNKSSKEEFFKFISKKKPHKLAYYFQMIYYKALLKINQIRMTEFKENFFNYLDNIPPEQVAQYAREFWKEEYPNEFNKEIKAKLDRYKQEGMRVVCATGALEVYVKPLFDELYPVDLVFGTQTKYNGETYIVEGKACKDEEKIKRLDKHFKGKSYKIVAAFSDSKEDILDQADDSWLVEDDGELVPYQE
jgi:HAD superfamily phosphoserine phosphatase-like hydrolase